MTASRRTLIIVLTTAVVTAAVAVTVMLALDSDSPTATQATTTSTTTTTTSPEDQYIDALDGSGHFPANVDTNARDTWVVTGRDACDILRANNGDIVDARLSMLSNLADFSSEGEGMAEEGLTEKAAVVVDAASEYLCPGVAAT